MLPVSEPLSVDYSQSTLENSGFVLTDIPSGGEAISELLAEPLARSKGTNKDDGHSGPESGIVTGRHFLSPSSCPAAERGVHAPTHVVYLDTTAANLLGAHEGSGGKLAPNHDQETKILEEMERYFEAESVSMSGSISKSGVDTSGDGNIGGDLDHGGDKQAQETGNGQWLPATAFALRDVLGVETGVVKSEADFERVFDAVDMHLTGGETPGFVRMFAEDDGEGSGDMIPGVEEVSVHVAATGENQGEYDDFSHLRLIVILFNPWRCGALVINRPDDLAIRYP